ncbi:virulence factor TspB C-terminal domain-related protein [Methyloversatilis sp. NSM2]|uniref:virulence factor TspB C-terminal domain-related protein n=1 Tax=Methyloversatilis sp. NSM2 TaxID=3134135 RepID=UPI0031180BDB
MDHLQLLSPQRLARALGAFLLSLFLTVLSLPAVADYGSMVRWRYDGNGQTNPWTMSPGEACASVSPPRTLGTQHNQYQYSCLYNGSWSGYAYATRFCFNANGELEAVTQGTTTCPGNPVCPSGQNYNAATGQCELTACASGQVRNTITQQCQPPCHAAGTAGGSAYVSPWTELPRAICRDGCKLNVGGTGHHIPWSNGTTLHVVNGLVHTGEFCSGDINGEGEGNGEDETYEGPEDLDPISVTPEEDPPRCGAGQCPGEFNGVHMCVSCTDIASPEKPVTTYDRKTETTTTGTPPNQTTETKTTDTKSTHDGSGTVTSTTTTSTTKTDANGTTTTEEGKTEKKESQESFCKENPTVAFCKNGKWGGGCDAFTCEGDAVQCAIAREIHQRNCDMNAPNEYSNAAEKVGTGTETGEQYLQTEKEREGLDVQGKFASEVRASPIAAACPAPRVVPLPGGNSLEISFEKPCEVASQLGAFVVAFAYLAAALIVLKSPGGA